VSASLSARQIFEDGIPGGCPSIIPVILPSETVLTLRDAKVCAVKSIEEPQAKNTGCIPVNIGRT
jgi:hypothetical protein